jgi:hypothetical protein
MRVSCHLIISLPLAAAFYAATDSWSGSLAAGAANVLIDLDHIPDYLWWRRGWRGWRDMVDSAAQSQWSRLVVLLHSWELLVLAALFLTRWFTPWLGWGLVTGWACHMACDSLVNEVRWGFYFLTFRVGKRFERNRLLPEAQPRATL